MRWRSFLKFRFTVEGNAVHRYGGRLFLVIADNCYYQSNKRYKYDCIIKQIAQCYICGTRIHAPPHMGSEQPAAFFDYYFIIPCLTMLFNTLCRISPHTNHTTAAGISRGDFLCDKFTSNVIKSPASQHPSYQDQKTAAALCQRLQAVRPHRHTCPR